MRLVFDDYALEDLTFWVVNNQRIALKVLSLIEEVKRSPFSGRGKPERLRHELSGCWSRRITAEHRLVYSVSNEEIRILSCRYHYDKQ